MARGGGGANNMRPLRWGYKRKRSQMLYGDVVLGEPRTSQYSPNVGKGHFLILHLNCMIYIVIYSIALIFRHELIKSRAVVWNAFIVG